MRGLRPQTATDRYGNPGANAHGTPKHTIASEYFQSSEYKRGCPRFGQPLIFSVAGKTARNARRLTAENRVQHMSQAEASFLQLLLGQQIAPIPVRIGYILIGTDDVVSDDAVAGVIGDPLPRPSRPAPPWYSVPNTGTTPKRSTHEGRKKACCPIRYGKVPCGR